jgi:mRNA interferase MazF
MGTATPLRFPKQGEVYMTRFDPAEGSEIQKIRPAVVLQNDTANRHSPVTIVAAVTSFRGDSELYPTEVLIRPPDGGLSADSVVHLNQLRTLDKRRLGKRMGTLSAETMTNVKSALLVSLGLVEL